MDLSSHASLSLSDINLVSIGAGLTPEESTDLLDLLAQAEGFASKHIDHRELWKSWLDRYRNRLEKHGCVPMGRLPGQAQVINKYEDFRDLLKPIVAGDVPSLLANQVLDSLSVMQRSRFARKFFRSGSDEGCSSSFVVTPCQKDAQGQIFFAVYAFELHGDVSVRDFDFWTETTREMVVWNIGTLYHFDRRRFADFREPVRDYLRNQAKSAFAQFDL